MSQRIEVFRPKKQTIGTKVNEPNEVARKTERSLREFVLGFEYYTNAGDSVKLLTRTEPIRN